MGLVLCKPIAREESLLHLPETEIERIVRQHMAAKSIQAALKEAYYNPEYVMCRSRLRREYEDLRACNTMLR